MSVKYYIPTDKAGADAEMVHCFACRWVGRDQQTLSFNFRDEASGGGGLVAGDVADD